MANLRDANFAFPGVVVIAEWPLKLDSSVAWCLFELRLFAFCLFASYLFASCLFASCLCIMPVRILPSGVLLFCIMGICRIGLLPCYFGLMHSWFRWFYFNYWVLNFVIDIPPYSSGENSSVFKQFQFLTQNLTFPGTISLPVKRRLRNIFYPLPAQFCVWR